MSVFNAEHAALACSSLCVLVALSSIDNVRLFHSSVMTRLCLSQLSAKRVFFPLFRNRTYFVIQCVIILVVLVRTVPALPVVNLNSTHKNSEVLMSFNNTQNELLVCSFTFL